MSRCLVKHLRPLTRSLSRLRVDTSPVRLSSPCAETFWNTSVVMASVPSASQMLLAVGADAAVIDRVVDLIGIGADGVEDRLLVGRPALALWLLRRSGRLSGRICGVRRRTLLQMRWFKSALASTEAVQAMGGAQRPRAGDEREPNQRHRGGKNLQLGSWQRVADRSGTPPDDRDPFLRDPLKREETRF